MNNIIKISTNDGIKIKVEYADNTYEYSTDSLSVDTSSLIKALAESGTIEEIEIDDQEITNYISENEISDEFNELYKFVVSIPKAYNKSINQMLELD